MRRESPAARDSRACAEDRARAGKSRARVGIGSERLCLGTTTPMRLRATHPRCLIGANRAAGLPGEQVDTFRGQESLLVPRGGSSALL
ncbi:hypothetical protein FKM82_028696 [Ascaphus truei]